MNGFYTITSSVLITFLLTSLNADPNAFCSQPVTDLVGISMYHAHKQGRLIQNYNQLPFSDKQGNAICTRLSQLLFNEQVEILELLADEYKIKIYHWYHEAGNPSKKIQTYWVDKAAITPFNQLSPTDIKKIPPAISFESEMVHFSNSITLINPFKNYSAGTRFVKTPHQKKRGQFTVFSYNPLNQQFEILYIPKSICIDKVPKSPSSKRKLFVKILKEWAHQKFGIIPYLFGGASIGERLQKNNFSKKEYKNDNKIITLFNRPIKPEQTVKMGVDCAHTIARAAQIVGIKYFVKNTSTLKKTLEPLKPNQSIEDGDILVWKGHTAVISSTKKGLLIEARGYDHGYGILQEIPFSEQFEGITTVKELKDAFLAKKPIQRLDKEGKKVQIITDLIIMKLPV